MKTNVKTKIKITSLGICLILGICMVQTEKKPTSSLFMDNIEALAQNEGERHFFCFGVGTIECEGRKVAFVIDNYK